MADVELSTRVDDNGVGRALDGLARDLASPASLGPISEAGARAVAQEAPRRTGRLAGGAQGSVALGPSGPTAEITVVVPYAGYVNYGTRTTPANPFMQRASDQLEPVAVRLLEADIDHSIRKRGLS